MCRFGIRAPCLKRLLENIATKIEVLRLDSLAFEYSRSCVGLILLECSDMYCSGKDNRALVKYSVPRSIHDNLQRSTERAADEEGVDRAPRPTYTLLLVFTPVPPYPKGPGDECVRREGLNSAGVNVLHPKYVFVAKIY